MATKELVDPNFSQTVILLAQHDAQGAFGLVLNRPLGELSLDRLAASMGIEGIPPGTNTAAGAGGPVEPDGIFVLHSPEVKTARGMPVGQDIVLSPGLEMIGHLADGGAPPQSYAFFFGYSGWGPGQLEWELAEGSWHTTLADPTIVFDQEKLRGLVADLQRDQLDL